MRAPDETLAHGKARTVKGPKDTVLALVSKARSSPRVRAVLAALAGALVTGIGLVVYALARRPTIVLVSGFGEPLVVEIDGRKVGEAESVSVETPSAGTVVRVAPGKRHLVAKRLGGDPAEVVWDREVTLDAWETYLFSPPHDDACFFLEHTAYASAKPERPPLEPLDPASTPWKMPARVDGWFVPTPRGGTGDKRSTGGTRTTVRQARCGATPYR